MHYLYITLVLLLLQTTQAHRCKGRPIRPSPPERHLGNTGENADTGSDSLIPVEDTIPKDTQGNPLFPSPPWNDTPLSDLLGIVPDALLDEFVKASLQQAEAGIVDSYPTPSPNQVGTVQQLPTTILAETLKTSNSSTPYYNDTSSDNVTSTTTVEVNETSTTLRPLIRRRRALDASTYKTTQLSVHTTESDTTTRSISATPAILIRHARAAENVNSTKPIYNASCINTTMNHSKIPSLIEDGKWFCGHPTPFWVSYAAVYKQQNALFMSSGVFFFVSFLVYILGHLIKGRVARYSKIFGSCCLVVGYFLTLTLTILHLTTQDASEQLLFASLALIVLICLLLKFTLHLALAIRCKSIRALNFAIDCVIVPVGANTEQSAFGILTGSRPQWIILSSLPSAAGVYHWTISGKTNTVHSAKPMPGQLKVYTFFGVTNLTLRETNEYLEGGKTAFVCTYSSHFLVGATHIRSPAARELTKNEGTKSELQALKDFTDDEAE